MLVALFRFIISPDQEMVQRIQSQLNKCIEFPFKGLSGVIGKKQIVENDRIISVIVYFEPIICIPVIVPDRF